MTVLELQVGASSDDAQESKFGVMYLTHGGHGIGGYGGGRHSGYRWTGVSGLSGATINAGTVLNFPNSIGADTGSFIGDWYAHDAEAPGTFTTTTDNISDTAQRPRTIATCEGDGADFGDWAAGDNGGAGWDFTGDGVNTIADIIQELADSYDPSAIALLHIYTSGTGARRPYTWDNDSSRGAKLDIDYTAATGDQTATPDPVTVPVSIPSPTLVLGGVTLNPDPVALLIDILLPSVEVGGITATPDPVTVPVSIPEPTIVIGGLTATPDPVAVPIVIPTPQVVGAGIMNPDPVVVQLAIPTPTVVIGGLTATPDPVAVPIAIPTPQLDWQANPSPVTVPLVVPTVSIVAGGVTLSPDPVLIPIVLPLPSIEGGAESYIPWGIWDQDTQTWLGIEMYADPDNSAPGSVFRLAVGMYTSAAPVPVKAYLYNITDGVIVAGSEITGTATSYDILRSGTFSLSSGLKKYRLEYGGEPGGVFYFHGGKIDAESS